MLEMLVLLSAQSQPAATGPLSQATKEKVARGPPPITGALTFYTDVSKSGKAGSKSGKLSGLKPL